MYAFPKVQSLRGELKRCEIRSGVRYQLTTKEFVFQRGLATYRIALSNVLGLVLCTDDEYHRHAHLTLQSYSGPTGDAYKIIATTLYLVSPTGVVEQNRVTFYTRLSPGMAAQFAALLQVSA